MGLDNAYGVGSLKPGVCTSTTRPASPYEGQVIYETDTDLVKAWNGSSWLTIGPTTVPTAGSIFVTSATFTTVSSVSMPSGTFTSTYDEYQTFFTLTAASAGGAIGIRVNNAGSPRTAANYNYQFEFRQNNGFSNGLDAATQTSLSFAGTDTTPLYRTSFVVSSPTTTTLATRFHGTITSRNSANTLDVSGVWGGNYSVAEAHDGLTFFPASGTFSGYYSVLGITK